MDVPRKTRRLAAAEQILSSRMERFLGVHVVDGECRRPERLGQLPAAFSPLRAVFAGAASRRNAGVSPAAGAPAPSGAAAWGASSWESREPRPGARPGA